MMKAPFTEKQTEALEEFQKNGIFHPYKCMSNESDVECEKSIGGEGILIVTSDGMICPCGRYKQDWANDFTIKHKI